MPLELRFRKLLLFIKEQRLRYGRTYIFDTGLASGKLRSLIRYDLLNLKKELQSPKKLIFAQACMISMILLSHYYGPDLDSERAFAGARGFHSVQEYISERMVSWGLVQCFFAMFLIIQPFPVTHHGLNRNFKKLSC